MRTLDEIQAEYFSYVNSRLVGHEENGELVLNVPWTDGLGESLRIVVSNSTGALAVDDDGSIFFAIGRQSSLSNHQQIQIEYFIQEYLKVHGVRWNSDDQVAEMDLDSDQVAANLSYFAQTIGGCITALPVMAMRSQARSQRHRSLGPRLATRVYGEFEAWVKRNQIARTRSSVLNRLRRHHSVAGIANPNWTVDFFYEPVLWTSEESTPPPVVIITVDLAVKHPVVKAEHAVTMSRDIALKGNDYTLRLAFAGDGENGEHRLARDIIIELAPDNYHPYNLDDPASVTSFTNALRSEIVGQPWF